MSKKNLPSKSKLQLFLERNWIWLLIVFVLVVLSSAVILNGSVEKQVTYTDKDLVMHEFYLRSCPHCLEQEKFHKTLLEKYPNLKIVRYEISSPESVAKYNELAKQIGGVDKNTIYTPTTFIGNKSNVGFNSPETTGKILLDMLAIEQKRLDALNS